MTPLPNPPELILLKALWELGPMPVRTLHDECARELRWSFSSSRKTLTRMEDKGFVCLVKAVKTPANYAARISKTTTIANMSRDFMRRVLELEGPLPQDIFTQSKILSDDDLDELGGLL